MRNGLVTLGIILVVAFGLYLFKYKTADAPIENVPAATGSTSTPSTSTGDTETPATPSPVIVTYSDTGYSPSSVTIKKGQAVRFTNSSESETWPASAIHPTHGVYPQKTAADCLGSAFDSCRGLKKSESWDFTFTEVGTWRYHDHLHARNTGTVIVTE